MEVEWHSPAKVPTDSQEHLQTKFVEIFQKEFHWTNIVRVIYLGNILLHKKPSQNMWLRTTILLLSLLIQGQLVLASGLLCGCTSEGHWGCGFVLQDHWLTCVVLVLLFGLSARACARSLAKWLEFLTASWLGSSSECPGERNWKSLLSAWTRAQVTLQGRQHRSYL